MGETNKSTFVPYTEQEKKDSVRAKSEFSNKNFEECAAILKKISKNHTNDPHLNHNKALTEFLRSYGEKVGDLKKVLTKTMKQMKIKNDEDEVLTCNDKSAFLCAQFNLALLSFNIHHYSFAEGLLAPLCDLADVDFNQQIRVHLLLAECYLLTHKTWEADAILSKLEKLFQQDDRGKVVNEEGVLNAETIRETLMYMKIKCLLKMKSTKACKREMKNYCNSFGDNSENPKKNSNLSVFLKSNFEYMRGNPQKALRVFSNFKPPSMASKNTSLIQNENVMLYYNNLGVLYFVMEKFSLGCYHMNKALIENKRFLEEILGTTSHHHTVTNNNGPNNRNINPPIKSMEILSKNLRFELLYNYGIFLLHNGLSSSAFEVLMTASQAFHSNPRLWLRIAECCIQKCTGCGKDESGNGRSGGGKKNQLLVNNYFMEVGTGCHRKLVIKPINNHLSNSKHNSSSTCFPQPTMEFAASCLRNALTILCAAIDNRKSSDDKVEKDRNEKKGNKLANIDYSSINVPCLPGSSVTGYSLLNLVASVLVNSAYVALHLGDTLSALHYSEKALNLPELSGSHRYLARVYAAEALVSLDRISKAISYLQVDQVHDIIHHADDGSGKVSPSSDDGKLKSVHENGDKTEKKVPANVRMRDCTFAWHFPSSLRCAKGYMLFNLATTHCLRSEYSKAEGYIKEGCHLLPKDQQLPPHAILLAVYVNLHLNTMNGSKKAIQILFQHSTSPNENSCPSAFFSAAEAVGYRQKLNTKMVKNYSPAPANNRSKLSTPQSVNSVTDKVKTGGGKNQDGRSKRRR